MTETQPTFDGLTRAVVQTPVYGLNLAYRVPAPSPRVPDLTGETFVPLRYLTRYADQDEWTDWGATVFERDPVLRSAMLDNGLAKHAYTPDTGHLRRTAKFVDAWNALFADLSDMHPLKHSTKATS